MSLDEILHVIIYLLMAPFLFFNAGSVQLIVTMFELQNGASSIIAVISLGDPGTVEEKEFEPLHVISNNVAC